MRGFSLSSAVSGVVLGLAAVVSAAPVTTSLAPVADTYIAPGTTANYSYGTNGVMNINSTGNLVLIRWDLSGVTLPEGNAVQSAKLNFWINYAGNTNTTDRTLTAYRIFDDNAAWVEGTKITSGIASDGSPTWNYLSSHNSAASVAWKDDAGAALPAADLNGAGVGKIYDGAANIGQVTLNSVGKTSGTFYAAEITLSPEVIQGWLQNPSTNAGIAIYGTFSGTQPTIASRSHTAGAPMLNFEYDVVPEPGALAIIGLIGSAAFLRRRHAR